MTFSLLPPLALAGEGRGEGGRFNKPELSTCGPTLTQPSPASGRGLYRSLTLIFILALTLLAACGKKGAPVPPGPANEIVYPRQYPSR